jgi:hypothetical protein
MGILVDNQGYRVILIEMANRYQVKSVNSTAVVFDTVTGGWLAVFSSQSWGEDMVKVAEGYATDLNAARKPLTTEEKVG